MKLQFCPADKCPHYSHATKYPRKCYYEPQCWRGHLDILMALFKMRFGNEDSKQIEKAWGNKKCEAESGGGNSSNDR